MTSRVDKQRCASVRYSLAFAVTVLALVAVEEIAGIYNFELPLLFLVPIVLLVARYLGFGPSLITIVLGALGADYFFTYPGYQLSFLSRENAFRFFFFVGSCTMVSWLISHWTKLEGHLQMALRDLRETERERLALLEAAKVAKRAAELERERADNANRAKSEFLANMSHEIRTPLGAVLGFTDLLRDPSLGESERMEFIDIISKNGADLVHLIDDLLDLSKIEAGKLEIERRDIEIGRLMGSVKSLLAYKAKEKNLDFDISQDGYVPERVFTDPSRLRQILINIVGNAIKFTKVGRVLVTVRWHRSPVDSKLEIEVCDTGPGIAVENQERLFKPFGQADSLTARRFGGSGLGLALSRRLARSMGGDIVLLNSRVGVGSTFLITVNAAEVTEDAKSLEGNLALISKDLEGDGEATVALEASPVANKA